MEETNIRIFKFRSMRIGSDKGSLVTIGGHDPRITPGITDPASIKFRNENELMEQAADPEDYYIHVIMQQKIALYLEYVKNASTGSAQAFFYDIAFIFKTFKVIVTER